MKKISQSTSRIVLILSIKEFNLVEFSSTGKQVLKSRLWAIIIWYIHHSARFVVDFNANLVLCNSLAGISRSPAIVTAYLMQKHSMALQEALDAVKSKRPIISPNRGFIVQLQEFEKRTTTVTNDARSAAFAWTKVTLHPCTIGVKVRSKKVYLFVARAG